MGKPLIVPSGIRFGSRREPIGRAANGLMDRDAYLAYHDDFFRFDSGLYNLAGTGTPTRAVAQPGVLQLATSAASADQNLVSTRNFAKPPEAFSTSIRNVKSVTWSAAIRFRITVAGNLQFAMGLLAANPTDDSVVDPGVGYLSPGFYCINPIGGSNISLRADPTAAPSATGALSALTPWTQNTWYTLKVWVKVSQSTGATYPAKTQATLSTNSEELLRVRGSLALNGTEFANGVRMAALIETATTSAASAEVDYMYLSSTIR